MSAFVPPVGPVVTFTPEQLDEIARKVVAYRVEHESNPVNKMVSVGEGVLLSVVAGLVADLVRRKIQGVWPFRSANTTTTA